MSNTITPEQVAYLKNIQAGTITPKQVAYLKSILHAGTTTPEEVAYLQSIQAANLQQIDQLNQSITSNTNMITLIQNSIVQAQTSIATLTNDNSMIDDIISQIQ